jgi:hypothetical protein
VSVSVNMDMDCGSSDSGFLDVRVDTGGSTDASCTPYTVTWTIDE